MKGADSLNGLISKKELLERYNISYGTLYRWKRMGLIPDDWLVKKSTYTGQETFFDEKQICERVEAIIAKKDTLPLEAIARELLRQDLREEKLKIVTKYWSKEFNISDLERMSVVINGKEREITIEIENKENIIINFGEEEL